MSLQLWSWSLTAVSVFGLWLTGRSPRAGWVFAICNQQLWLTYAIVTHQWGFALQSVLFCVMYARNLWHWRHGPPEAVLRHARVAARSREPAATPGGVR